MGGKVRVQGGGWDDRQTAYRAITFARKANAHAVNTLLSIVEDMIDESMSIEGLFGSGKFCKLRGLGHHG
jgi:hypothetical protein